MPERLSKSFGDSRMCLHHTSRHCSASPSRTPITPIETGFFGTRAEGLSHGRVHTRASKTSICPNDIKGLEVRPSY